MEYFNDWGGGDTTITSPGRSPKQPLPGTGLHDLPHGRQACSKFISFHEGVGQISPREGLLSCRPLPKRGQICDIPALPPRQSLNDSVINVSVQYNGDLLPDITTLTQYVTTIEEPI